MDESSNNTTLWGYANMIANENEATAGRRRRLDLSLIEQYEEVSAENSTLQRAKHQLTDDNALLRHVVTEMANRSEAMCRVIDHLRRAWTPSDPAEAHIKNDLAPLDAQKQAEVAADPSWPAERAHLLEGWKEWGKAEAKKTSKKKRQ